MLVTEAGLTHASSVIPELSCSEAEFGTSTRAFVPLNESAPPYLPDVVRVELTRLPALPLPELSVTVEPEGSSNEYAPTSPVVAARVVAGPNAGRSAAADTTPSAAITRGH